MHITYSSISVRDLCESGAVSVRRLGQKNSALLQQVHADLQAAENLADLPPLYSVKLIDKSLLWIETDEGLKVMAHIRSVGPTNSAQAIRIERVLCNE